MFNYRNKYNKGKKRAVADQPPPNNWKVCFIDAHCSVFVGVDWYNTVC